MAKPRTVLVIPDLHIPYEHPSALKFCDALNERYKPDEVVLLGDELDFHSISFHPHDGDLLSPSSELDAGIYILKDWYLVFPKVTVLESNHGSLVFRRIKAMGLSARVIKPIEKILEAPKGWHWKFEHYIDLPNGQKVYFHHGRTGLPGKLALQMGCSAVQGHYHEKFHIKYWRVNDRWTFDAHVGCLVDPTSLAMAYAKNNVGQVALGAMVIENSMPKLIPMELNSKGKWAGKLPF